MTSSVFECGHEKCGYAIASEGMSAIQLKALRMWKKTCPQCGHQTQWQEKLPLLNTDTLQIEINGGSHAKTTIKNSNQVRRPKRRTDGDDRHY